MKQSYSIICPKCNKNIVFKSKGVYEKTLIRGICNKCANINTWTCPRCSSTLTYKIKYNNLEGRTHCKICKNIPDESLSYFNLGKFVKFCPRCNEPQFFKSKQGMLYSLRRNLPCKSCMSTENGAIISAKRNEYWKSIVGHVPTINMRSRIRNYLKSISEEEKSVYFNKSIKQKNNFWSHFNRKMKNVWYKNLQKAFEKYHGENHWMNRPETMAKIHSSYIKYLGKNHWIHRPGVKDKIFPHFCGNQ
jgi:hypothetical protein